LSRAAQGQAALLQQDMTGGAAGPGSSWTLTAVRPAMQTGHAEGGGGRTGLESGVKPGVSHGIPFPLSFLTAKAEGGGG